MGKKVYKVNDRYAPFENKDQFIQEDNENDDDFKERVKSDPTIKSISHYELKDFEED